MDRKKNAELDTKTASEFPQSTKCMRLIFQYFLASILGVCNLHVHVSQLVRIGRICSNFVQFNLRHYTLIQKFMKQGFWYSGLCMAFKKFARSHVGIITKYECSVRKHIEEGICMPTTDAFLSRNICTRTR